QLARLLGNDPARKHPLVQKTTDQVLQSLRCIAISHLHADHVVGIFSVLKAWTELDTASSQTPLVVVGPQPLKAWLFQYSLLLHIPLTHIRFVPAHKVLQHSSSEEITRDHAHDQRSRSELTEHEQLALQQLQPITLSACFA